MMLRALLLTRVAAAAVPLLSAAGGAAADGYWQSLKDGRGCVKAFHGFYVGAQVGTGFYTSHHNDLDGYFAGNAGFTASERGIVGGPQVGYNIQSATCRTLFGIEADWAGAGLDAETRLNSNVLGAGFEQQISSRLTNYGTLRTRVGIVIDYTLLYVTGGLAIAGIDTYIANTTPLVDERFGFSDTRVGWTAGVGTEWALGRNISLKSDFLYLSLGEGHVTLYSPAAGNNFSFRTEDSAWVGRFGLSVRLGF
jgi:outer membrane immunogenic protein